MKNSGLSIAGFVLSLSSILFVAVPFIGMILFSLAFIFSFVGIFLSSKKGMSITGIVISALMLPICFFSTLGFFVVDSEEPSNENVQTPNQHQEEQYKEEQEEREEVPPAPQLSPEEIKQNFIDSCVEIDYDELRRNPEDHLGNNVVITVCVRQILEGHHKGKDVWRAYTDDSGYGLYFGDEYFLVDCREVNDLNIITEDIIIIYGTFEGMESVYRITGSGDKLPRISVKYLELVD